MNVAGPGTPYITPEVLRNASTGIAWGTIPRKGASEDERLAEQWNICWRATGDANGICHQVLQATVDTEQLAGPGTTRVNIDRNTGNTLITVRRWPVLKVVSIGIAQSSSWPWNFVPVPDGQFAPATPPLGVYGTSAPSSAGEGKSQILLAPGWLQPGRGRGSYQLQVKYENGWPHAGTTGNSAPTDQVLDVDDCTGWAPIIEGGQGACGTIMDGARQEIITCTGASATTGPGTLTLAAPLTFGHEPGVIVTTMPPQAQEGVILLGVAQALERGATATTHQQMPGQQVSSSISDQESAEKRAAAKLLPFARVI